MTDMNQNIATLKTELVQMVEAANDLPLSTGATGATATTGATAGTGATSGATAATGASGK